MAINPEIKIDLPADPGVAGVSREELYAKISGAPILVTLSLGSVVGVTAYEWSLVDRPVGSTAVLSSTTAASPTFTADQGPITGTYLIRCIINFGTESTKEGISFGTEVEDFREPAAGETNEFDLDEGWKVAITKIIRAMDAALSTNTLNEAYDEGGAGAGRTITVDSGPVALVGVGNLLFAGDLTPSGDDSAILMGRGISGDSLFSHGIRDESTFTSTTTGAYSSYDSQYVISGATHYNHMNQYQARAQFNGTDQIDACYGLTFLCTNANTGTINQAFGLHVLNPVNSGGGAISDWRAIYIPAITATLAQKYAFYSVSTDLPSFHGGFWQTGGDITAAGNLLSTNLKSYVSGESTNIGVGFSNNSYFFCTTGGTNSGNSLSGGIVRTTLYGNRSGYNMTDANEMTAIGAYSAYSSAGADGGVYLGHESGYFETADNKLFIDNAKRTNEADGRVKALLYGVFDAATANQVLTCNGNFNATELLQGAKGADLASATDMAVPGANYCDVTGTTQIDTMATTGILAGCIVVLQFDASVTVKHNTAGAGALFLLSGAVDFSATVNDTLTIVYDGTNWRESARAVI